MIMLPDLAHCQAHGISLYLRHHGVEEFGLFVGGGVDLPVEGVATGHQLVDAGDDAVLFGEGGNGCGNARPLLLIYDRCG